MRQKYDYYVSLYHVMAKFVLTKRYVNKVKAMIFALCPIEKQCLQRKTMQICLSVWCVGFLIFYILFVRNPGIYTFVLACFFVTAVTEELLRLVVKHIERRILRQMEKMLNDVRHFYYDTHSISVALQESEVVAGDEIKIHIELLLEVLSSENIEEAVEEYNRSNENRFLKLFLSQCVAIQEYGDTERNGESVFVRNLSSLREDILNYLLQLDRLQLEFGGLTFISLTPILVLPLIRTTAIATLPELFSFYHGTEGTVWPVIYLVTTALVYSSILEMQELDAKRKTLYALLQRLGMKKYIAAMLNYWERHHYGSIILLRRRLRRAGEQIAPKYFFLSKILGFCLTVSVGGVVLIYAKGKNEQLMLLETCILLLIGVLAYFIPDIRLRYRATLMRMNMLSEVTQFQSIIMMQMFIPDITVLRILMTMEQFAVIFRQSIRDCINEYSYSVTYALSNMKESENYEPFRRLCDNLLTVDKIGIERSFEEIIQDREHFQRQREADSYRMIRKKSGQAKLIAFIPMLLIMVTYLILPYGMEAMRQFSVIMQEINGI